MVMKILVIDNYDSFVFNLVHMLYEQGVQTIHVVKNDKVIMQEIEAYDKILLSPGPGLPQEAGLMPAIIEKFSPYKSMLGVCLGHQAIAEAFGARLKNLDEPLHGVSSELSVLSPCTLFKNCPLKFQIGHYHSWVVEENCLPPDLKVLAKDSRGNIMAIQHVKYHLFGVQFHPESVLTEYGHQIISNWLNEKIL
jgi:anthranilate synthase component 2